MLTTKELDKLVQPIASKIMEHADSIVVIVTGPQNEFGDTFFYKLQTGNSFANIGAMKHAVLKDDAYIRGYYQAEGGKDSASHSK